MEDVKKIIFESYKSFNGVNEIVLGSNITLFIGRNNSGKSSVLDVIEAAYSVSDFAKIADSIGRLSVSFILDERHIKAGFQENISGGDIGSNHYYYGKQFLDREIVCDSTVKKGYSADSYTRTLSAVKDQFGKPGAGEWQRVATSYGKYDDNVICRRIDAERNIVPEEETESKNVSSTGEGATNLIRLFINHSGHNEDLVEQVLLKELNTIMNPETEYENIRIQQIVSGSTGKLLWEVFLTEKGGHRYALSKCGSGLKTILLVLINLFLVPNLKEYENKTFIFMFEELENNLHPALQRNLFAYLLRYSKESNNRIILTSHSHVAINSYYGIPETSLYHVIKEGTSSIHKIENYIDKTEILNDLDVRASDILQSNGIIWVEGPSDRIYLEHWLKIFCNNVFEEGKDYQYLYYGGRLLSHYTADESGIDNLISILTTNRNAAIVIDSDRKKAHTKINDTKKRIQIEFQEKGFFCWITKGKEIENYIGPDAWKEKYSNTKLHPINQYEPFNDYFKKIENTNTNPLKVEYAKDICRFITRENSANVLDLKMQIERLYKALIAWNSRHEF